jgi:PhnB protein
MSEAALNQTVTAYLACNGAAAAIDFYKRAFGAEERYRIPTPDGGIGHAELLIGNSLVYLADEWPEGNFFSPSTRGGPTASFMIEVPDCDAAFARAIAAGGKEVRPLRDEPYGRTGDLEDPFGHRWSLLTVNPNFKPEDMMPGGDA